MSSLHRLSLFGFAAQRTNSCLFSSSDKSYYKAMCSALCRPKALTLASSPKSLAHVAVAGRWVSRIMCAAADTHPSKMQNLLPLYWPPSTAHQATKRTSPSFVLKYSNLCEESEQLCSSCSLLDEISRISQVEGKITQKYSAAHTWCTKNRTQWWFYPFCLSEFSTTPWR